MEDDMMKVKFTIPGRPRSWKRPGQNGRRRYSASEPEKRIVAQEAAITMRAAGYLQPTVKPVRLSIHCAFKTNKRAPGNKIGDPYIAKPDIDNLAKLVMDGMNKVVYNDDAQVMELTIRKTRAAQEWTTIIIEEME
jgi:Holliday junction resolvase RusA-like endonuclease